MCLVVDYEPIGYYLLFNIPIVIYFLAWILGIIKFERGIMQQKPYDPNAMDMEGNLLPKPTNALSPALYNKIR